MSQAIGEMTVTEEEPKLPKRSKGLLLLLISLGLLGVATLLLVPLEEALPPGVEVPRAVLLIQPAMLILLSALAGWWAAPKVGLESPMLRAIAGKSGWFACLRDVMPAAIAGGVLSAGVLVAYGVLTGGYFGNAGASLAMPMITRVGYGGISEEIMLRWGMMSVLALLAVKLGLSRGAALWAGNLTAAALFAVGHLPALYALVDPPIWLLVAVLAANASAGVIFGWLYARRGLEAAMIAHALAHLIGVPAAMLLLAGS